MHKLGLHWLPNSSPESWFSGTIFSWYGYSLCNCFHLVGLIFLENVFSLNSVIHNVEILSNLLEANQYQLHETGYGY